MKSLFSKAQAYYEKHEMRCDLGFFLAGVLFDVFTLSDIDDLFSIAQQVIYLSVIGSFLYFDFLHKQGLFAPSPRFEKIWTYRDLIIHFLLGSLLSLYSLFYLKSASVFASFVFIGLMLGLMVANELKTVQQNKINLKIALYLICVFSFFSMMFPVIFGFVGVIPFLCSLVTTGLFLYACERGLSKRIPDRKVLHSAFTLPGGTVLAVFLLFYLFGWIPPVPLSVQEIGIYHQVEKQDQSYVLFHENPWWRFWRSGDQEFLAEPGDQIFVFVRIFSPARFDDSVLLHWQYYDPKQGWLSSDRIPMRVVGGRDGGFRGFAAKKNYSPGEWRVLVETTDKREVGRLKFWVSTVPVAYEKREFTQELR